MKPEYVIKKQPKSIELYIEKLKTMNSSTVAAYQKKWGAFIKQYQDLPLAEKLPLIIQDITEKREQNIIADSTYRIYKSAVCYGLAATYVLVQNDLIEEDELDEGLNQEFLARLYKDISTTSFTVEGENELLRPRLTSSMKKKYFPQDFYQYLAEIKEGSNCGSTKRFLLLFKFIQANLVVGLRPSEWLNVSLGCNLKERCFALIVKNGKNSFGRANGEYRYLNLIDASSDQITSVESFYWDYQKHLRQLITTFERKQESFVASTNYEKYKELNVLTHLIKDFKPTFYPHLGVTDISDGYGNPKQGLAELAMRSIQNELYERFNAFKRLADLNDISTERPTIYSTRHQCIANAKASNTDDYEIAGFFGHSSIETNGRHYGKAWHGWSNFSFKPANESIEKVHGSEVYFSKNNGLGASTNANTLTNTSPESLQINKG